MKILVTGVSGQLGYDVCRELARRGIDHRGVSSREMPLTRRESVRRCVEDYGPDAVIHCAAWTKVDAAEEEREACFAVNAEGTRYLAEVCRDRGIRLLYISTDYVFPGEGEKPYTADDAAAPKTVYGQSKYAGEQTVRELVEKYFIVRISWVFGVNGNNFVKTMLRLAESRSELSVVADQIGSPTYTVDLARLLCDMIVTERYGVYLASNEGYCSWAEFAEEIFRQSGKSVKVRHILSEDYPARAPRPKNSRMDKSALEPFGRLPRWEDALGRYLKEIG